MNYYTMAFQKYAEFKGRSSRKEYWMFVLINLIVFIVLNILEAFLNTNGILVGIYSLAIIIPGLAVAVRRLHDTGRSAWWILIGFIPFVGPIIAIVLASLDSQAGENKYGPNPKGVAFTGTTVNAVPTPASSASSPVSPTSTDSTIDQTLT